MSAAIMERLTTEFEQNDQTMERIISDATEAGRDLTSEEDLSLSTVDARQKAITAIMNRMSDAKSRRTAIGEIRTKLGVSPMERTTTPEDKAPSSTDAKAELAGLFRTAGEYGAIFHRSRIGKDPAATAMLERGQELMRAISHQTTDDNPGLIPEPILGDLINRLIEMRPFIGAITNYPATSPKFQRPIVTQHVDVDEQLVEKTEVASQVMKVGGVEVVMRTFAGVLNISRQDLKWTNPAILDLVFQDFLKIYAKRTDRIASQEFPAAVTTSLPVADWTEGAVDEAIGEAADMVTGPDGDLVLPDTIFMSKKIAKELAKIRNPLGQKIYNVPLVGFTGGDMHGLRVVINPRFPAGTWILGDAANGVEYWEATDGFLTVDEPTVRGLETGYAGFGALAVTDPSAFVKLTAPIARGGQRRTARAAEEAA